MPNKVILAYQTFGPLLDENEAISEYIMMAECPSLDSCLPEVVSVDEAVLVADAEYRLADDEQAELARLLSAEPEPNAQDAISRHPRALRALQAAIGRMKVHDA